MNQQHIEFFLNSKSSVVLVECIELIHPNFSQTHRVVRNATRGIEVRHPIDDEWYDYTYYPLKVERNGSLEDLDFGFKIDLGDLGGNLQLEVDRIADSDGFQTKPRCVFRGYRSDDLTSPIEGPLELEVTELAFNSDGAQFDAVAPYKNISSTGEIYELNRFPMLRGFL